MSERSAAAQAAIDEALGESLGESGCVPTSWTAWVEYLDENGDQSWLQLSSPGAHIGTQLGHLGALRLSLEDDFRRSMEE